MSTIFISLIPLAFKTDFYMFHIIDAIAVMIFIVDYLLRWGTADYKLNKKDVYKRQVIVFINIKTCLGCNFFIKKSLYIGKMTLRMFMIRTRI